MTDVVACLQHARDRDLASLVRVGRTGAGHLLEPIVARADAVMVSDVSRPQDLPESSRSAPHRDPGAGIASR